MPRLINFTLIFSVVLSSTIHSQNFDALTSKIFFNVDIKKHDTTRLSDFNAKPELTLQRDTGWTVYPPTDNKGNLIPFYRFSFSKHPYFLSDLNSGGIIVMLSKNSDKIIGMSMSFSIMSAQACDSIYRSLTKSYTKYASKTIKRPNIGQPFEVTKYLSEDGIDYVIITKGESDKRPFIHIAYNYQDYDW